MASISTSAIFLEPSMKCPRTPTAARDLWTSKRIRGLKIHIDALPVREMITSSPIGTLCSSRNSGWGS